MGPNDLSLQVTVVGTDEVLDGSVEGVRAVVLNGLEVFLPLAGLADPVKEVRPSGRTSR